MAEKVLPARRLVSLRAGSHLYSTATPRSDLDVKFVYLPGGDDILLQRTPDGPSGPGLEDAEGWSLQRLLGLVCAGQPVALEALFAPEAALLGEPDPWWREVQALAPALVTRNAGVFARYSQLQAAIGLYMLWDDVVRPLLRRGRCESRALAPCPAA